MKRGARGRRGGEGVGGGLMWKEKVSKVDLSVQNAHSCVPSHPSSPFASCTDSRFRRQRIAGNPSNGLRDGGLGRGAR